jgi:hypothetical protein
VEFAAGLGTRQQLLGATGATLTTVTAGSSNHAKGAWVTLGTAAFDASWLWVQCLRTDTNVRNFLLDVGVGPPGSEVVLIPDLLLSGRGGPGGVAVPFPVPVPAGTRVAARCQSSTGGAAVAVGVRLVAGDWTDHGCQGVVRAYGVSTSNTRGTDVDPGATANTYGSPVFLSGLVSSAPARWMVLAVGERTNGTVDVDGTWLVDVGVLTASGYQWILPAVGVQVNTNEEVIGAHWAGPVSWQPGSGMAGGWMAVRAQSSIVDATDRLIEVAAYLVH